MHFAGLLQCMQRLVANICMSWRLDAKKALGMRFIRVYCPIWMVSPITSSRSSKVMLGTACHQMSTYQSCQPFHIYAYNFYMHPPTCLNLFSENDARTGSKAQSLHLPWILVRMGLECIWMLTVATGLSRLVVAMIGVVWNVLWAAGLANLRFLGGLMERGVKHAGRPLICALGPEIRFAIGRPEWRFQSPKLANLSLSSFAPI